MVKSINAATLKKMFLAGAAGLEAKKEWINELNVFPVPDGDTGTNMTMTIMSAAKLVSDADDNSMADISKAISNGSLRGARGNSGVILSQLFRGFTKVIASVDEIDNIILTEACQKAVETAYKAVMKPKEGTILTVAKGIADEALDILEEDDGDVEAFVKRLIDHGNQVLAKTPDMLPVLKQAGVVDSGGQGLMVVLESAFDAFLGKEVDFSNFEKPTTGTEFVKISSETEEEIKFGYCTEYIIVLKKPMSDDEVLKYKAFLESIGDSIVVVADDEIVKTHVHTNDPGLAMQEALKHGSLSKIKVDNMREEHEERLIKNASMIAKEESAKAKSVEETTVIEESPVTSDTVEASSLVEEPTVSEASASEEANALEETVTTEEVQTPSYTSTEMETTVVEEVSATEVETTVVEEVSATEVETTVVEEASADEAEDEEIPSEHKEMGFVSVAAGDGLVSIFKDLGVDQMIEGGQTMNPSTDDILTAIEKVNADVVYVLPNNKNIILAANQARDLCEDKKIYVIPTKTVPQGITALINFIPENSPFENFETMSEAITGVKTAQVTYAVRDTVIDDKEIHENDYMGLGDYGLLSVGQNMDEVLLKTIDMIIDDETSVLSIYFGSDIIESKAESYREELEEAYPYIDIEINNGGQPVYYYIISAE